MDVIFYSSPAYDGNPDGIIDAPKGAQFYKSGSFYKINYSGSVSPNWQNVRFIAISSPAYVLSPQDEIVTQYSTGSYLYVKSTNKGTTKGWTLLAENVNAFVRIPLTPTPTTTLTPTPTPTVTYTPIPSVSVTLTPTKTPTPTPSITSTGAPLPTVTRTPYPTIAPAP